MNVRVCSASAFRFLVLAWVVCLQWTGASWARQQDPSQTEIEKLIEQLSSDSFDARREAKDQLASLGVRAVPALAEAAGKDTDAAYSAVRILSRMLSEGDEAAVKAARKALQKLAEGKNAIARQARETLQEADEGGRAAQAGPGRLGLRAAANFLRTEVGPRGVRTVQRTVADGTERIMIREPDRTLQVTLSAEGEISVRLIPTDARQKPATYEAASAKELREKHPEAWKLYEEARSAAAAGVPVAPVPVVPGMPDLFRGDLNRQLEQMQRDRPARLRRLQGLPDPEVETEIRDARLLVQDLTELVAAMKTKSKAAELARMEAKLDALKRSLDRIEQRSK